MPLFKELINALGTQVILHRGKKTKQHLDSISRNAIEIGNNTLLQLVNDSKDTEYGKLYHFDQIKTVEDYQKLVPIAGYDDFEPYVSRMIKTGESGLLTNKEVVHYALSSGSIGVPKHIPVTEAEISKYDQYITGLSLAVADEFYRDTGEKSFRSGYFFSALIVIPETTETGVSEGSISSTTLFSAKKLLPFIVTSPWEVLCPEIVGEMDMKYLQLRFCLPEENVINFSAAFMPTLTDLMDYLKNHWEMLCDDIEKGCINSEIKLPNDTRAVLEAKLKPDHKRANQLRKEFMAGFNTPIIPRIWPNMKIISSIGTGSFSTYRYKMWEYSGKNIPYSNVGYAASEGLMAAARHVRDTSFVLIPDGGFYEFIPVEEMDNPDFTPLTIKDLEENKCYEILLTNLSGLYRYRIKDVIRVTGFYNEAPMIEFMYRTNQVVNFAGEKTNEAAIRWSVDEFMRDSGIQIIDYSVYADTDTSPGHYVFLMEPDSVVPKEQVPQLRDLIEKKLSQANPDYAEVLSTNCIAPLELIFVQQQTYQLYRELLIRKGASPNQLKPVRVIDTPLKKNFFYGLRERYDE